MNLFDKGGDERVLRVHNLDNELGCLGGYHVVTRSRYGWLY